MHLFCLANFMMVLELGYVINVYHFIFASIKPIQTECQRKRDKHALILYVRRL